MSRRDIRFATPKMPREQQVLFPQRLDEVVDEDAPVRTLVSLLEGVDWSPWEERYAGVGQPAIHPRYLAGAILWGLLHRMRSSRILERASRKDLDFIWLLEGFTPDHSTFANFRTAHGEAIKALQAHFAKSLLERREQALLCLILDGTRLRADSGRQGARKAETIEYIIGELQRRMDVLKQGDEEAEEAARTDYIEGLAPPEAEQPASSNPEIARLEKKLAKYHKALEIARERDAKARKHNGKNAKPARVPVTDPESQILPNKEGGYAPNYTPAAGVDVETGAIVYADVVEGSQEASAVLPAVVAAEELTGQPANAVLADGNFAAGPVLDALDQRGTAAYMPTRSASPPDNPDQRPDPSVPVAEEDRGHLPRTGQQLDRSAFIYDAEANVYYCPMGNVLRPHKRGTNKEGASYTEYQCADCAGCPLFEACVKGKKKTARGIVRDEHEPLREAMNERMATPEGQALYRQRAPGIEGVFGHIKANMGIRRFNVRGLNKVRTAWNWVCTAYNLKKLLDLAAKSASGGPASTKCPQTTAIQHWIDHTLLLRATRHPVTPRRAMSQIHTTGRRRQHEYIATVA